LLSFSLETEKQRAVAIGDGLVEASVWLGADGVAAARRRGLGLQMVASAVEPDRGGGSTIGGAAVHGGDALGSGLDNDVMMWP
jgi:hypothetical protein